MQTEIPEETSKRITALRFLLAVLVVFIHNNFTAEEISTGCEVCGFSVDVFNNNFFGTWLQSFISKGIASCAVPLFFLFAAYLQAKKNAPYKPMLKKKVKTIFLPLLIWEFLYFLSSAGLKFIVAKFFPDALKTPDDTFLKWPLSEWIYQFFGYKFENGYQLDVPGIAGQFWFVRDLFILTCLSGILIPLVRKMPVIFFLLISYLLFQCDSLILFRSMNLFFYIAGLYWGVYDVPVFEKLNEINWFGCIAFYLFVFIISYISKTESVFVIFATCLLVLKFSALLIINPKVFEVLSYLAGYSFFLYAIHMPVLNRMLQRVWLTFFPMKNTFFCLFEYFGVSLLIIAIGTGIGIALKKICPPAFRLLNGGR